jgi:hypothetical protein
MVHVAIDICYTLPFVPSSIIRIDIATLERTVLLQNDGESFGYSIIEWPEADLVVIFYSGQKMYLNPWTGEITTEP